MADLETQLRSYATGVLDGVEPVRADEITTAERLPLARHGRVRVAVAIAASVVLAVSALWLVSRDGGQVRVTSQSGAVPRPTHWTQTASLDTDLSHITAVPGGLVAIGDGGIWFSSDAHNWKNMFTPELTGLYPPVVRDVVDSGHGLVAVGTAPDPGTNHGVAAVWTSPDAQTWTRVRDPALEPVTPPIPPGNTSPDRSSIAAIVRGGPGLVAVGEVFTGTFDGPTLVTSCCTPTAWTSRDGSQWTRVDHIDDPGGAPVDAITRQGATFAFATTVNGTDVVASRDGAHWHHVGIVRGSVSSVAVHGTTLVAVGSEPTANQNARASIWTSNNGVSWRRTFAAPAARITSYTSVATNGRWLVAVGYRGRYEVGNAGVMAISTDARHWVTVRRDGGAFTRHAYLAGVTAFGQGLVAIGTASTGTGTASNPVQNHTVVFTSSNAPARAATSTRPLSDGATTIRQLEHRPLRVAQLRPYEACPQATITNRITGIGPIVETGPIAASTGDNVSLQYGHARRSRHTAKVLWLVRAEQSGPVIVRGSRIDGTDHVRWANNGAAPTLALTTDARSTAPPEWRDIPSGPLVHGSGCYAFQIDGTNFESVIILRAEPAR